MAYQKTRSSSKFRSKKVIGAAIVVAVVLVVAVLELTNTTHFLHSSKATSGKIPVKETSKAASSKSSKNKTSDSSSTATATPDTAAKNPGGGASGAAPQAPFGGFVSNHSPSLSNGSEEQSSCVTTPGATCTITFTNDSGTVKTLPAQTTDSNGNTSWDWDVKTAGFTEGNWTIKVTSALNGQTQSVTDKLPLSVKP